MIKKKIFILILLFNPILTFAQSSIEIAKKAISSTVSIIAFDNFSHPLCYGSGFIIDDELIATNIHVIEGSNSVIIFKNGDQKKYTVSGYVAIDKTNDLVILKVPQLQGTKINFGSNVLPEIGEKVYAVGNPKGLNGTFSEGIISGIREIKTNSILQITAPISPGSSGGPVLNSQGQVIGIAFASFLSGQNLNFAIPINYLIALKDNLVQNTPIIQINIKQRLKTSTQKYPDVKNGVLVRNINIGFNCDPARIFFSIKNNLAYRVSDIRIIFLIFDKTGTIIDSAEDIYYPSLKSNEPGYMEDRIGIKPFLARAIDQCQYAFAEINWSTGYKISARVLDFKIIED
jgi:hypothetical protein